MDDKFWVFDFVLSCAGIHYFSKEKWDSKLKYAHQIFNIIVAIFAFIFTTVFIIMETEDVSQWIEGVCIWITGVIMYLLIAISLIFRKEFRAFIEEMAFRDNIMDMPFIKRVMKTTSEGKLKQLKQLVNETQRKLVKYSSLLLTAYVSSTLAIAVLYVGDAIYQMTIREDESLRLFGFDMWFPWKLDDFRVYVASFVYHAYAGFLCVWIYPGVQCTIIFLLGQMTRQLRILTFIIYHLDDLVMEMVHARDDRWQAECTNILSQCVNEYITIKRFGNRLNKICRSFYLTLILDAIILVCVCSVKIVISDKFAHDTIKFYMHGFLFGLIVLLFCVMGQQVQNECKNLEEAVLEKWYIYNKKHQVHVKIFHFTLMRNMPIYIFGSITLSLPTFNWFLKTGMSFFTLAMSLLEGA